MFEIKPEYFDAYEAVAAGVFKEKGVKLTYEIKENMKDIVEQKVLITDSSSWYVPELELEVEAGTAHFVPIKKLIDQVRENTKRYCGEFELEKDFEAIAEGKKAFTFIIEDPLGNAFILTDENDKSNKLTIEHQKRTPQQENEYGIQSKYNAKTGKEGEKALLEFIKKSNKIVLLTGAGCSTESNIPSYRGNIKEFPESIWTTFDPTICTIDNIVNSSDIRSKYWELETHFMAYRDKAKPNDAHHFVRYLQESNKLLKLVTQNIDDLYDDAGILSENQIKIHGTMSSVSCLTCKEKVKGGIHECLRRYKEKGDVRCETCKGIVKPDTIAFGQALKADDLAEAFDSLDKADLFIVMGTSLAVAPINKMANNALRANIPMVLINYGEHTYSHVADVFLNGKAGELSQRMLSLLKPF